MQRIIHLQSLPALTIFSLIFVVPVPSYAQSHELAYQYLQQAKALSKEGRDFKTARMDEKSTVARQTSYKPWQANLAAALHWVGLHHYQVGEYDKAIEFYEQALEINKKFGMEAGYFF